MNATKVKTKRENILRTIAAHVVSWFVPRANRRRVRVNILFGVRRIKRALKAEPGRTFPHNLAIVAIARNEGRYFQEWIEYHRIMGVEKFLVYDNESTDNTFDVLKPYIDSGVVEYFYVRGDKLQKAAYDHALGYGKDKFRWLAFIDLDEFIVPLKHESIPDFLSGFSADVAQIFMKWKLYGSSGHVQRPDGLVIENYKYAKADNSAEANKVIVNPRLALKCYSPHVFHVVGRSVDELGNTVRASNVLPVTQNVIRVNHYRCKSWQDSQEKHNKGDAFFGKNYVRYTRVDFDRFDTNEVVDNTMDKFVKPVKQACK